MRQDRVQTGQADLLPTEEISEGEKTGLEVEDVTEPHKPWDPGPSGQIAGVLDQLRDARPTAARPVSD